MGTTIVTFERAQIAQEKVAWRLGDVPGLLSVATERGVEGWHVVVRVMLGGNIALVANVDGVEICVLERGSP